LAPDEARRTFFGTTARRSTFAKASLGKGALASCRRADATAEAARRGAA